MAKAKTTATLNESTVATTRQLLDVGARSIGNSLAQNGAADLDAAAEVINKFRELRDALPAQE